MVIPTWPETVTMKTAAALLGWDEREVRAAILAARKDGILIGSGQDGYFVPKQPGDLLGFYRSKRQRALSALRSLTPTRKALAAAGYDLSEIEGRKDAKAEKAAV